MGAHHRRCAPQFAKDIRRTAPEKIMNIRKRIDYNAMYAILDRCTNMCTIFFGDDCYEEEPYINKDENSDIAEDDEVQDEE